jgi:CHASE3 domain sensor protein
MNESIRANDVIGSVISTGTVGSSISVGSVNHVIYSEPKQTLAEAADEIQKLLKQLEKTNPSATESQQIAYIDIAAKPELKQRAIAALKEGGETAIEEFFLGNKYLKIAKAVVKGWLQSSD